MGDGERSPTQMRKNYKGFVCFLYSFVWSSYLSSKELNSKIKNNHGTFHRGSHSEGTKVTRLGCQDV